MTNIIMSHIYRQSIYVLLICIIISCGNSDETLDTIMNPSIQIDRIKNMTTLITENGRLKMYMYATKLNKYNNDSSRFNFPQGVNMTLYNDSIKPETFCIAKYADYWKKTGLLLLKDSVVIWNTKGDTLMSNELWWDKNTEKIYTNEPIFIHQPGSRMKGTCWRSNDNLTNYSICNMEGIFENRNN
ncbi:MAG: LPS export ABC transporter periplasmic protein LptC, partial [Chitinophagaceae bacterium]